MTISDARRGDAGSDGKLPGCVYSKAGRDVSEKVQGGQRRGVRAGLDGQRRGVVEQGETVSAGICVKEGGQGGMCLRKGSPGRSAARCACRSRWTAAGCAWR